MKAKLQNKIYKEFDELFKDRDSSMQETCMCWGLDCGDGWYNILLALCQTIKNIERNHKGLKVVADQVKEKYGTLSFYYHTTGELVKTDYAGYSNVESLAARFDDMVEGAVWMSESLSSVTCEVCGNPGKLNANGWYAVRCKECCKKENS